jgi:predicted kinase
MANLLLCTVGLPRSGKTTWARAFAARAAAPLVDPDAIRLAFHNQPFLGQAEPLVYAFAQVMVRALFNAGHPLVVVDDTNMTAADRARWSGGHWVTRWKVFDTPRDECLRRASTDRQLRYVICGMAAEWEPLGPDDARWSDAEEEALLAPRGGGIVNNAPTANPEPRNS